MNTINAGKTLALALLVTFNMSTSVYASDVIINGKLLSYTEKVALENQIGTKIVAGNYVSDGDCWVNLTNGTQGCLSSGTVNSFSRYGSGESNAQGDWNHWSNAAGGAVGGSSDGCVYTSFGWSSC